MFQQGYAKNSYYDRWRSPRSLPRSLVLFSTEILEYVGDCRKRNRRMGVGSNIWLARRGKMGVFRGNASAHLHLVAVSAKTDFTPSHLVYPQIDIFSIRGLLASHRAALARSKMAS